MINLALGGQDKGASWAIREAKAQEKTQEKTQEGGENNLLFDMILYLGTYVSSGAIDESYLQYILTWE